MSTRVTVSVIVNAVTSGPDRIWLSAKTIGAALSGIDHEIILLVDGERADDIELDLRSRPATGLQVIGCDPEDSAGLQLNAGVAISTGDVILALDDCMMFSPAGLKDAIESVRSAAASMVIIPGRDLPPRLATAALTDTLEWSDAARVPVSRSVWAPGSPVLVDRDSLLRLRGFDEKQKKTARAFCDLKLRMKRMGVIFDQRSAEGIRCFVAPAVDDSDAAAARADSAGDIAERLNRLEQDETYIRNVTSWKNRPADAPPLVTVAIATYNRADYLRDSINSVLAQTVEDFELIVVDDGSTDATRLVVESFDDERVKYVYQENRGIAAARNTVADISRGTFTAVHDDDDIMLPWRLEVSLSGIKAGVQASYGSWVNFDDITGEMVLHVIREQFCMPVSLVTGQTPGHATWLVETRLIRQFRYNETISSAVDHNLALRMMRSGVSWVHTGKVLFLRRMHPTQVSNSDGTRQKYAAELSRFMLQFAGSDDDIAALKEESKAILWPKIAEKGKLEESFGKYLPDHLAVRSLHVQGNVANKASRLQKLKSTSFILCEEDETGKIVGEYADFLNVTLEDLAAMQKLGVSGRLEGELNPSMELPREAPAEILDRALRSRLQGLTGLMAKPGRIPAAIVWTNTDAADAPTGLEQEADLKRQITLSISQDYRFAFTVYVFEDEPKALQAFARAVEGRNEADLALYRRGSDGLDSEVAELRIQELVNR
ncbi:glycosyltransferase family 2 protein [Arthrobacter sp. H-02-3]|uniref:glycosyltransferase family 2 protein n=1 Tax=Arthrobacter sp. H-02-3 TaxID=2703675 RepID=UPI001057DA8F|nr:glycosyltransferase family 2 protein [Arthrobacter sp. H-02-3]